MNNYRPTSSREDSETFYINGYMIYHSRQRGWVCDCKGFMFGNKCKHITQIIEEYGFDK